MNQEQMKDRLAVLIQKRDETNAKIETSPTKLGGLFKGLSLREQLDEANAEVQEAQDKANSIAAQIQEVRGGAAWLELKKEIALLSKALSGK